jgi:dihydropteroate synthase
MGVVNASPESFSDGGRVGGVGAQLALAEGLLAAGAAIVDVGGESGVTNRPALSSEVEIDRVVPLVDALAAEGVLVSVDTWKAQVAAAVLDAGAHLINDVSGLRDPTIAELCADAGAGLVIMHTRAEPKVKAFPRYDDVLADVEQFFDEQIAVAIGRGLSEEHIVLDPGPDFAKTPAQTVTVLRGLDRLQHFGRPIMLAASRKDFIGAVTERTPRERLAGTLAAVADGLDRGASILRVHDVTEVTDFIAVRRVLRGDAQIPPGLMLAEHLRRET